MSDVGDVNRAHMQQPEDPLDLYVKAARQLSSQNASMVDRMVFDAFHNAANVAKLGDRIDTLRDENRELMELLYGDLDTED